MKIIETQLPGCVVIEPQVFGDDRGFFYESFNHDKLAEHGLQPAFVQVPPNTALPSLFFHSSMQATLSLFWAARMAAG